MTDQPDQPTRNGLPAATDLTVVNTITAGLIASANDALTELRTTTGLGTTDIVNRALQLYTAFARTPPGFDCNIRDNGDGISVAYVQQ